MARKLTDDFIRNAQPGNYTDGIGVGLILRVSPTGRARSWFQKLTIKGTGKRREIGLGSYPNISIEAARGLARNNKELAKIGIDPLNNKRIIQKTTQDVFILMIKQLNNSIANQNKLLRDLIGTIDDLNSNLKDLE